MTRLLTASALALSLLGAGTAAQAQSYTAPAGIPSATAPGSSVEVNTGRSWNSNTPGSYDSLTTGSVRRSQRGDTVRR